MKDLNKHRKLLTSALESFIEVCSDLHAHGLDVSENTEDAGELLPIMRKAYKVLSRLEGAKLVAFNEPKAYAKILEEKGQ